MSKARDKILSAATNIGLLLAAVCQIPTAKAEDDEEEEEEKGFPR
jgi:hypothetical protein